MKCGRWDSNPRTPKRLEPQSSLVIDLEGFTSWFERRNISPHYKRSLLLYIKKCPIVFNSPAEVGKFIQSKKFKRYYSAAIANYINYLDERGLDFSAYKKYLEFERTKPDLRIPSDDKVKALINALSEPYRTLGLLLCYSGLRLTEAVYLFKSFDMDKVIERESVCVYPLAEFRGNKNAFYAYLPIWLTKTVTSTHLDTKYKEIGKKFRQAGLAAKYLRKWNYNALVRAGVDLAIGEYIQGRSFNFIGGRHYLGAMERACEAYTKALPFIDGILSVEDRKALSS